MDPLGPVAIPPEALLILEERLKDRPREDVWPPPEADITEVALLFLVAAELMARRRNGDG